MTFIAENVYEPVLNEPVPNKSGLQKPRRDRTGS